MSKAKLVLANEKSRTDQVIERSLIDGSRTLSLYHLSTNDNIIPEREITQGAFGDGFYMTPAIERMHIRDERYLGKYILYTEGIKVFNFLYVDRLHWVAEVLYNLRGKLKLNPLDTSKINEIIQKYRTDTSKFDVLVGYSIEKDVSSLDELMGVSKDRAEYCIKSRKAFNNLRIIGKPEMLHK